MLLIQISGKKHSANLILKTTNTANSILTKTEDTAMFYFRVLPQKN
jgi:hypothetical protein